jgi:hypothetical protein
MSTTAALCYVGGLVSVYKYNKIAIETYTGVKE